MYLARSNDDLLHRYLMMSAQATIMAFVSGYPEVLAVTYENPDFNYQVRILDHDHCHSFIGIFDWENF